MMTCSGAAGSAQVVSLSLSLITLAVSNIPDNKLKALNIVCPTLHYGVPGTLSEADIQDVNL